MGDDSGEKTEQPTPHKLSELKKKGQVAKSKDFTSASLIVVSYFSLKLFAFGILEKLESIMVLSLQYIQEVFTTTLTFYLLREVLITFMLCVLPLFGMNLITALLVEYLQVGAIFSFEPLKPKLEKLNPIEGVKKLFTLKQLFELAKSILKMSIIIIIIVAVIREDFSLILLSQETTPIQVAIIAANMMFKIVIRIAVFYLIVAIIDLFYQRYEFTKSNKMSQKEIKDEYKKLEGDPLIKSRQRDAQRQMSQGRQMGSVPDADVVVTNPTYIAIAICYVPNKMKAPKILAKGKRLIAANIRDIAQTHQIPIVENPTLARNLYDTTQVGQDVPLIFYKAVAQILAFVYKLKNKRKMN